MARTFYVYDENPVADKENDGPSTEMLNPAHSISERPARPFRGPGGRIIPRGRRDTGGPSKYEYLILGIGEIRLFTLRASDEATDIPGFLSVVEITDELEYEALSYVWGSSSNGLTELEIEDGGTLAIRENLADALVHLRRPRQRRVLWIDAICIDQENVEERNSQVALMGQVYAKATSVLIWLGPKTDVSGEGLEFLRRLMEPSRGDEVGESGTEMERRGLLDVLDRKWWQRMWVVQEVAFSERAVLMCGEKNIRWPSRQNVQTALTNLQERVGFWYKEMDPFLQTLEMQLRRVSQDQPSLMELFELFQTRECSDPRDRVFALLGMAAERRKRYYRANYSLSVEAVICRLMVSCMSQRKSLDVLSCNIGPFAPFNGPSWLLNWMSGWSHNRLGFKRRTRSTFVYRPFDASGDSAPSFVFDPKGAEPHLLRLHGFVVDQNLYCLKLTPRDSLPR